MPVASIFVKIVIMNFNNYGEIKKDSYKKMLLHTHFFEQLHHFLGGDSMLNF